MSRLYRPPSFEKSGPILIQNHDTPGACSYSVIHTECFAKARASLINHMHFIDSGEKNLALDIAVAEHFLAKISTTIYQDFWSSEYLSIGHW